MSTETEGKTPGDVVRVEFDANYNREVILLGESVTSTIGAPLDQSGGTGGASLITNGNEANVDAIALEAVVSGAGENQPCLALVRGPCIIDSDQLDLQASVTVAELTPYLKALGILPVAEPTNTETL